jgi:hypothetical protein
MPVEDEKLATLRELITEGLRVQLGAEPIEYINVSHSLEDACSKANHTIFARRGCGKTLLLHYSQSKLRDDLRSIYLNCEDFKQHTFPNVLIEILKALFRKVDQNLSGWFGKKARTKALIRSIITRLEAMQQAPDSQHESVKEISGRETAKNLSAELGAEQSGIKAKLGAGGSTRTNASVELTFERHKQKLQELDLWLPELKDNLREFFSLSTNVRGIFLQVDDLYHLRRTDQAFIVDYIHRLCKDVPLFFKFATIRHASSLYIARGQPIGAQERHDYQPINIDFTFSDFTRTEQLNWQILKEYGRRADLDEADLQSLFKGEGFARLVMAGGGVPRDVLSLFLEAMSSLQGEPIGKDEVRVLSRPNLERRIEELKQDAHTDEQSSLIAGIYALREFCLNKRTNIFLVPEQLLQKDDGMKNLFNRLMDYRIIHHAGSALTHKSMTGNFQAFAIDIGAYAHFRKMQGRFTEIDVSDSAAKDKMRSAPVLDDASIRALLKNVPEDAEEQLRALPAEEGDEDGE